MTMSSCGDFLEESSQDHDYVRSWNDLNELLIGDCYMPSNRSNTFDAFANPGMFLHLLADELQEVTEGAGIGGASFDQHEPQYGYIGWQQRYGVDENYTKYFQENTAWTTMYKYINVANNILEAAKKLPAAQDEEKAGVSYVNGQAHFLRAFYLFWLTNTYGQPYSPQTAGTELGVPVKTTKEVEDIIFQRATVQECYDQIVADLHSAEQEFEASTMIPRKSVFRADITSVQMLLSRVYLYMQDWDKAAEYAQKVITAKPALQDLNNTTGDFATKDNPETIFSMGGDDLPVFQCNCVQCLKVSDGLFNSYSINDARRDQWFWEYGAFHGLTKQPFPYALYDSKDMTDRTSYWKYWQYPSLQREISSLFWLRTGEAYLILAEAEAYRGNEEPARTALNTLRRARFYKGTADCDVKSEGSQLISDIRNERRIELLGEGHRWFDLRRYRVCSVQPEKVELTHTYTCYKERGSQEIVETRLFVLEKDDPAWTCPIPQDVIDFNVGMPNNGNRHKEYTVVK